MCPLQGRSFSSPNQQGAAQAQEQNNLTHLQGVAWLPVTPRPPLALRSEDEDGEAPLLEGAWRQEAVILSSRAVGPRHRTGLRQKCAEGRLGLSQHHLHS